MRASKINPQSEKLSLQHGCISIAVVHSKNCFVPSKYHGHTEIYLEWLSRRGYTLDTERATYVSKLSSMLSSMQPLSLLQRDNVFLQQHELEHHVQGYQYHQYPYGKADAPIRLEGLDYRPVFNEGIKSAYTWGKLPIVFIKHVHLELGKIKDPAVGETQGLRANCEFYILRDLSKVIDLLFNRYSSPDPALRDQLLQDPDGMRQIEKMKGDINRLLGLNLLDLLYISVPPWSVLFCRAGFLFYDVMNPGVHYVQDTHFDQLAVSMLAHTAFIFSVHFFDRFFFSNGFTDTGIIDPIQAILFSILAPCAMLAFGLMYESYFNVHDDTATVWRNSLLIDLFGIAVFAYAVSAVVSMFLASCRYKSYATCCRVPSSITNRLKFMSRFSTLPSGVFRKNIRKNAELNIIAFGAVVLSCFLRPLGTQSPVLVSFLGPVAGYVLYKFYQYASKCCPVVMQEEKVTREELRLVSINQNPKWFAASCAVWQGFAYIIPYYAGAHFFEHDDGTKWDSDVWLTGLACYSAATAGYLVTSAFLYAARKTSCYNSTSYEDKPYGPHFDEERQRRLLAGDQPPGAVLELRERSVSPGLLRL